MTDTGKEARFENMTQDQIIKLHSRSIASLEMIWQEVATRLDAMAGDDRTGEMAQKAAMAEAMLFELKGFHRRADAFAAKFGNPAARTGER